MAAGRRDVSDEDYWLTSSASKASQRGLNVFDDDVNFDEAKNYLKQRAFDDVDDDEVDTINWDGSSAVPVGYKSARYRPEPSSVPGRPPPTAAVSTRPSSHVRSASLAGKPSTEASKPSHSRSFSGEPALDDIVSGGAPSGVGSSQRKQPTITEMSKLEAQVNYLKRQLEASRKDKFAKIPPRETIKRIITGEAYSLESYRSKEDKLMLMDEAIRMCDGNAIIATVLFLKDTVKKSIFMNALISRPVAVQHYISYLRQYREYVELVDLLSMLGRSDEAAMIKYKQAVSVQSGETKLKNLKICLQTHFSSDPTVAYDASLIQDQISLIEVQLPIEDADVRAMNAGDLRYKGVPREGSIIGRPVIDTLHYACIYHYDMGENSFNSPLSIKKTHRLSDKQFLWTAINARSRFHKWADIEALFQTKGWFGGKKLKSAVPFDKIVSVLHEKEAPRDVLNMYCALIDDADVRLDTARKHGCYETVIDTLRIQRDRHMLQNYAANLKAHSPEWFYAQDVLKRTDVKWKN